MTPCALQNFMHFVLYRLVFLKAFSHALLFIAAGIRVQSFKEGQITMDVDLRWGGDPNIVLGVAALVASIPIQVNRNIF